MQKVYAETEPRNQNLILKVRKAAKGVRIC
jgi:hypothetical protein